MAYIYPLNNPGGVHLTVCDFTRLSPPPKLGGNIIQNVYKSFAILFIFIISEIIYFKEAPVYSPK